MVYRPRTPVVVTIQVVPNPSSLVYAIEEMPPNGWFIIDINNGGVWDFIQKKVKWGPFFDSNPRTFTYKATPPIESREVVLFSGKVSFDGSSFEIGGSNSLRFDDISPKSPH